MYDPDTIPCPECGYEGPHNEVDDSAVECGSCYASIDIRDHTEDASYMTYPGELE